MIDIVIPVRDAPSMYDDLELKFCLRSIEKHMPGVSSVWLIGIPRPHLSVYWIEQPDEGPTRYDSTRKKLLAACACPHVSDPFLLFNDDFFLLRPPPPEIPDYYDGTIHERIASAGGDYRAAMIETLPYSDGRNYGVHVPLVIDKALFKRTARPGMLYRNVYCSASPRPKAQMADPKIYNHEDHLNFRRFIQGKWMFSASEHSFAYIYSHMKQMYSDKSRWE